ncbi:MAG: oxygenase MpaB family protein [Pedobacter sp.]|nr:oxygenase MpaB family protein [Pedobacter sp.]
MALRRFASSLLLVAALQAITSHADSIDNTLAANTGIILNPPPLAMANAAPAAEPAFWVDAGQSLHTDASDSALQLAAVDDTYASDSKPFSAINTDDVERRLSFRAANSSYEPRWITEAQFEKQLKLVHKTVPDPKVGLFGPDSMMWKINRYIATGAFGAGQAMLLQFSHPWITQGVDDHSKVRKSPVERARNTFRYVLTMMYGSREQALQAAKDVRRIHEQVQGYMRYRAGPYAEGSEYRANEEAAMVWVHATLWETQMKMYEEGIGKVSDIDKEQYYQESKLFAYLFGIREEVLPPHWLDFVAYCDRMRNGDQLAVTTASRDLADYFFGVHGWGGVVMWPAMQIQILITKANLPPEMSKAYGFSDYTWFGKSVYATGMWASRVGHTILPDSLLNNPAWKEAHARIAGKKAGWFTRMELWIGFGDSRLTNDR